jgi:hypothetical protein
MKNYTRLPMRSLGLSMMLLAFTACLLFSFKETNDQAEAALQLIGLNKTKAGDKIKNSLLYGYLDRYGLQSARKIAVGDRAGVTKDLLVYAKSYTNSEAFATAYASHKELALPQAPKPGRTIDQIRAEYIKTTKEGIASSEKALANMPAEYHKSMQEGIDALKKQLEEYEKPESELMKILADGEKQQFEWATKDYQSKLQEWEKSYPENARLYVKMQLQKMLDKVKSVDFNAALREERGLKKFVNPAYESKPAEWKIAFRAGKEVVETTIPFVQQWIAEIK